MFSLVSLLPQKDKEILTNYIDLYGIDKNGFVGANKWLTYWGTSKIKLYKLLDNNFIYNFKYTHHISKEEKVVLLRNKLKDHPFKRQWNDFCYNFLNEKISIPGCRSFNWIVTRNDSLVEGVLSEKDLREPIKHKKTNKKQSLVIPPGTKIMRAIQKIIKYFEGEHDFPLDEFEDFQNKYSQVNNLKNEELDICLSVHPMDFITMSDNNSNWSSCMNWVHKGQNDRGGCYHLGTVEMMNSNNVIVAYIKNNNNWNFDKENEHPGEENYTWNDKRWRQLFLVTKEMIVSGKAYPYQEEALSKRILSELRKLALKNLSWPYQYGPELYLDMIHYTSRGAMDRVSQYIATKDFKKHQIIFSTKAMYNDLFNDHDINYWCVRNYVNHVKMISYSGKAPCLHCMKEVPKVNENSRDYEDYNERYSFVEDVICKDCFKSFQCTECKKIDSTLKHIKVTLVKRKGITEKLCLCEKCFNLKVKICPKCGDPMYLDWHPSFYDIKDTNIEIDFSDLTAPLHLLQDGKMAEQKGIIPCYICAKCAPRIAFKKVGIKVKGHAWSTAVFLPKEDEIDIDQYKYKNLKGVEPSMDQVIAAPTFYDLSL